MDAGIVHQFLQGLAERRITERERAIALLWVYGVDDPTSEVAMATLCRDFVCAGYARPNVSRLLKALKADKRAVKGSNGRFRIKVNARRQLDADYLEILRYRPVRDSDAVLPTDLFHGTRGYIEKVVRQLNASYEAGLYDCCAVMCRRLIETLIVEVYEKQGFADELKGPDGNFMMLSGLVTQLENDKRFHLGRNTKQGLKDFKVLGDKSAHDRRFNARRQDIDRVQTGLRSATEDLLHLAKLI